MNAWEVSFLHPWALLLAIPAFLAWWYGLRRGRGRWWRLGLLVVGILAAAGPEADWGRGGSDVVVILDRSASMPLTEQQAQQEQLQLIGDQRLSGDRLAVIAVGDGVQTLMAPAHAGVPRVLDTGVPGSATDLASALDTAAALITPGRTGRVIIHGDGEHTGLDPRRLAADLALREIPVDVLPVSVPPEPDAAIIDVDVPGELRLGESFIGAIRFGSDRPETRDWELTRDGTTVASGTVTLEPGRPTAVSFADRPVRAGLTGYVVTLAGSDADLVATTDAEAAPDAPPDRRMLNNTARAAVRVAGGERVLVMSGDGSAGNITQALSAAGLQVDTVPEGPIGLDRLLAYRVLVLDQVPAGRLTDAGMRALAQWVEHLGGGLVMTGGRRSFGSGGYHKSPVEDVLPVTMELRDEHRKQRVAMAICLDRSGSMGAPVGGGRTKMDLANEGTASVIELLGPADEVAVYAVDSAPHEIIGLTSVDDVGTLTDKVRRIESMGGGIYVYEALVAGGQALLRSKRATRHLVLFADAADAENPDDYKRLLAEYIDQGITVSVIGLGTDADPDANFLKDIAKRGAGRINFSTAPEELPRLFAQETVLVARSSWVDEAVMPQPQPALATVVGHVNELQGDWPVVPGYNLVYPKERADILALAPGDPQSPAVASWHIGAGRTVAVTLNLDDPGNPGLFRWEGYVPAVAGLVRWAGGGGDGGFGQLTTERAGRQVRVQLALDPAERDKWPVAGPDLALTVDGGTAVPVPQPMIAIDDGVYEAIIELPDATAVVPAAVFPSRDGTETVIGPAQCLPYSPEAEPRYERRPGADLLAELATMTGGAVRLDVAGSFDNPPSPGRSAALTTPLLILALLLWVLEILIRRLDLGWRRRPRQEEAGATTTRGAQAMAPLIDIAGPTPAATPAADAEAGTGLQQDEGLHEALRQLRKRQGGS